MLKLIFNTRVPTDILGWNHLGYCQEPLIQTEGLAFILLDKFLIERAVEKQASFSNECGVWILM